MLQEVLGSLGFNVHIALANFFNFLIIFFLLQKFLFKKIAVTLEERRKTIEDGVKKSEESEHVLLSAKKSAEAEVHAAEKKANEIVKSADEKGRKLGESIKADALTLAETIKKEASDIKNSSYEAGLLELAQAKEKLFASMFEKALGEYMNKDKNDAFIKALKK